MEWFLLITDNWQSRLSLSFNHTPTPCRQGVTYYVVKSGSPLQPPQCWDYKWGLPCLAGEDLFLLLPHPGFWAHSRDPVNAHRVINSLICNFWSNCLSGCQVSVKLLLQGQLHALSITQLGPFWLHLTRRLCRAQSKFALSYFRKEGVLVLPDTDT